MPIPQLAAAWWLYREGQIRIADLRTYLACHELVSRRCTLPRGRTPSYRVGELRNLTYQPEKSLRASIRRLDSVRLVGFSPGEIRFPSTSALVAIDDPSAFGDFLERLPNNRRLLPIPRRILRLIAAGARPALIATVLGHLLRCLYVRGETWNNRGRCKASWIADTFEVAESRVKEARGELIRLGWLQVEEAGQWELNRWGGVYRIDLGWTAARSGTDAADTEPSAGGSEMGPPHAEIGAKTRPPIKTRNSLREFQHQEPAVAAGDAGVSAKTSPTTDGAASRPSLRNILPQDLRDTSRALELYEQAAAEGLVGAAESDRLRFVAAVEHALAVGTTNPCGLLAHIVRGGHWHLINQRDEDAANARLKSSRFAPAATERRSLRQASTGPEKADPFAALAGLLSAQLRERRTEAAASLTLKAQPGHMTAAVGEQLNSSSATGLPGRAPGEEP